MEYKIYNYTNYEKIHIIGNIDNTYSDIIKIIQLQHYIITSSMDAFEIHFSEKSEVLNAAISVLFGALFEYCTTVIHKSISLKFETYGSTHPIYRFMRYSGIIGEHTESVDQFKGKDFLPFRKIKDETIMDEYASDILRLSPIQMQKEAQDILASHFYEIYQNSFYHSNSKVDVFSTGQWLPDDDKFSFSIYDMGIGIPNSVKTHPLCKEMSSKQCMQAAFIKGFSSSENDSSRRGLGLNMLENFIKLNNGVMRIYTDTICMEINNGTRNFYDLPFPILGTLFLVDIIADKDYIYYLTSEEKGNNE